MIDKFKNFLAANGKRNMVDFGLFPAWRDLTWIQDNAPATTPDPVTVAYSATPVFELSDGLDQYITLIGDVTSSTIVLNGSSTIDEGTQFWLHILQDATGGRYFAFPIDVRNPAQHFIGTDANTMTSMLLERRNSGWDFITPPVEGPTT